MITRARIKEIIRETVENELMKDNISMIPFVTKDEEAKKALLEIIKKPNFFQILCIQNHSDPKETEENYHAIAKWINENLSFGSEYLEATDGAGASRFVFRIGNEEAFVIKIAYDFEQGVLTNQKEIGSFIKYGTKLSVFPRIYLSDKQSFEWFVVEMVDVPEGWNAEIDLGNAIKRDFPVSFSNLRSFLQENLPSNINSKEFIDMLIDEVPQKSWFGISGGNPSIELFYFLTYLHEYQGESDIFVEALRRSDIYLMFSQDGSKSDYENIAQIVISTFSKDPNLKMHAESFKTLGVEVADLGVGNLGISKIDGSLKVIDISIFNDPTFTPNFLI